MTLSLVQLLCVKNPDSFVQAALTFHRLCQPDVEAVLRVVGMGGTLAAPHG